MDRTDAAELEMLSAFATVARQWWANLEHSSISQQMGLDLSDSELVVVYVLGSRTRELRPGDLAERLGVSRPTLSKLLTRLRGMGMIHSAPADDDRRAVHVLLTPAGREVYCNILAFGVELIRSVSGDFSQSEVEAIRTFLTRFANRLGALPPILFPPMAREAD